MENLTPSEHRYIEVLNDLRQEAAIDVQTDKRGRVGGSIGGTAAILEMLPELNGVIFDPSLERCSLRFSEISSHWQTVEPYPFLNGEFKLVDFFSAILAAPPPLAWDESPDSERQLFSEFREIDGTPRSGAGMLAAVRIQPYVTPLEIWFYNLHGRPLAVKMDVDYCGYLDALLLTKGVFGWQYLFTDISLQKPEFSNEATNLKRMIRLFPEIFPRYDYAPLAERLERRI